eukprot:CAMPEP_0204624682 /NCGR_PEP_ID=MMETSP0717-20131115/10436_1 /ASSEMBLY_ACC=CAM_ASM_000666 /TAXON_ID=230516 /ORGANISM="Chaetoceros curvisetus" /LENGTH=302 /DNA_ID=CAMNT_0051640159 /DNA_START=44 /DNA_END=949 /DNA_ORIENTATION=+
MIQAGLLRHYLGMLLRPSEKHKIPHIEHRIKNALSRSSRLRSGAASYISKEKWESRITYWTGGDVPTDSDQNTGYLKEELQWLEEEEEKAQLANEEAVEKGEDNGLGGMPDPMAMMGPMKGQFAFMAQNMVMMQGIGYFFSGYVLVKVPIPLTTGFKGMFQRGLDLSTLETSYVSSVSWYFLVMFGLRAFFKLVIEGDGSKQKDHMEASMIHADMGYTINGNPTGPMAKSKFDAAKSIRTEIENLELCKHKSILDDADRRLLGKKYMTKKIATNAGKGGKGDDPGYDIFGAAAKSKKKSSKV